MSGIMDKARRALLTDPVTGEPLDRMQRLSLAIGAVQGVLVIVAMLIVALGLGAGR